MAEDHTEKDEVERRVDNDTTVLTDKKRSMFSLGLRYKSYKVHPVRFSVYTQIFTDEVLIEQ